MLRILSSLVLAPIAIAVAYFGGIAFTAFWTAAALAVLALPGYLATGVPANVALQD